MQEKSAIRNYSTKALFYRNSENAVFTNLLEGEGMGRKNAYHGKASDTAGFAGLDSHMM